MTSAEKKCKVLMAGIVPPPIHGLSLMTQALFNADLEPVEKILLPIRSSKKIHDVGKPSLRKFFGVFALVAKCYWLKLTKCPHVLYYTTGSAAFVPFVRDVLFLGLCRPFFSKTILHYHSGGFPDFLNAKPWRRRLGAWVYGRGAWAISLCKETAVPGMAFGTEREIMIPNGISAPQISKSSRRNDEFRILFVGNLYKDKGIFDLLEATKLAAQSSQKKIRLICCGNWPDLETKNRFFAATEVVPENLKIDGPNLISGEEKWRVFASCDLFVFPTFYRAENLPLVVIEAMASSLPVISTNWRGLPSLVTQGETGFLVDINSPEKIAEKIQFFLENPNSCQEFGRAGRQKFEAQFSLDCFVNAIKTCFLEANKPGS